MHIKFFFVRDVSRLGIALARAQADQAGGGGEDEAKDDDPFLVFAESERRQTEAENVLPYTRTESSIPSRKVF